MCKELVTGVRHVDVMVSESCAEWICGLRVRDRAPLVLLTFFGLIVLLIGILAITDSNQIAFAWINGLSARVFADDAVALTTMFGEGLWLMALLSVFLLFAPRVNFAVLYASPLAFLLTQGSKHLLHVPRPSVVLAAANVHLIGAPTAANSCPSGHSLVTALVATTVILGCTAIRRRPYAIAVVLLAVCVIGLSRIAIGAHWPMDVLVGIGLGVIAGSIGMRMTYRFSHWECQRGFRIAQGVFMLCACALLCCHSQYPQALSMRDSLAFVGILCSSAAVLRDVMAERRRNSIQPLFSDAV
jgi:membrane-associated phospholipid phosphatase